MSTYFDCIIVGAGAAGVFSAINIKKNNPNISVVILEKTKQSLAKVKISGGGRCNVTHACFDPKELVKLYPRGQKELLGPFSTFQPGDTISWFSDYNVELKIEDDGRMFPTTDSSQTIIDCFLSELDRLEIPIIFQSKVDAIHPNEASFNIETENKNYRCKYLVVTTGGFNKRENYQFIEKLGIDIISPAPSLFTFNLPNNDLLKLQGIATNVEVKLLGTKFEESGPLLITHWGVSGPAILKLSSWAARYLSEKNYEFDFSIKWLTEHNEDSLKEIINGFKNEYGAKKVINQFGFDLPKKIQSYLLLKAGIGEDLKWADVNKNQIQQLINISLNDIYHSLGKTTFKQEFVSCGGVKLTEVNFKTMESKKIPNLYFAGEVLDIDALTGGFNFQAAWTTGYIVATSIASNFEVE